MPHKMRPYTCPDCGVTVIRRGTAKQVKRCQPCGLRAHVESVRQLHAHSGPWYDLWVRRNLEAAERIHASAAPAESP